MAEEVTKVVENIDKLFSEIVVNGESHVSDRYVPPEPAQSNPPAEQEEEEIQPAQNQQTTQGGYVDTLNLNGVEHDLKDSPLTEDVAELQSELADVEELIPNQASAQNKLADKNFVNSSISTNTANFLGTYSTLAEIEAIPDPTNNDYAFLETADASGNNLYDRYKYSAEDGEWLFEYELNNSSFTAEQWATINSGLTQSSVETLVNDEVAEALASPSLKQPIFDFCHPVGETYTQYPEQLDPVTLYNQNGIQSTWILLDYGGAFFRAEGGNALAFNNSKEVTAVSGAVLTIPSSGASVGCLIYDPVGNETRTVTAVSGNSVTVNSAFTSPILTNVLIGQSYQNAYHSHSLSGTFTTGGAINTGNTSAKTMSGTFKCNVGTTTATGCFSQSSTNKCGNNCDSSANGLFSMNLSHRHQVTLSGSTGYDGSSTDKEARGTNMTIRVWKRTA